MSEEPHIPVEDECQCHKCDHDTEQECFEEYCKCCDDCVE